MPKQSHALLFVDLSNNKFHYYSGNSMPCKTRFEWATTMSTREHPFLVKKKIQHNYALAFNKHVYHFHIVWKQLSKTSLVLNKFTTCYTMYLIFWIVKRLVRFILSFFLKKLKASLVNAYSKFFILINFINFH